MGTPLWQTTLDALSRFFKSGRTPIQHRCALQPQAVRTTLVALRILSFGSKLSVSNLKEALRTVCFGSAAQTRPLLISREWRNGT